MRKDNEKLKFLLIGILALNAAFFIASSFPGFSSGINDLSVWYIHRFSRASLKDLKIVGISIDEYSLGKINENRWPWKRAEFARLLNVLNKEGVKTAGFDFVFAGKSDAEDDTDLKKAFESFPGKAIIGAAFPDVESAEPGKTLIFLLPLSSFRDTASVGMVNSPRDHDGKIRRLYSCTAGVEPQYYSMAVLLAASYSGKDPERIVSALTPRQDDKSFFINYSINREDIDKDNNRGNIKTVSFYDVQYNLDKLKENLGKDFLKDAMVLVYPGAEIIHDVVETPLGRMPGGLLHLNGAANILSGRVIKQSGVLPVLFLLLSFPAVFYILRYTGFISGFFITLGLLVAVFWAQVIANLSGIRFDFSHVAIFALLFYISGSIYKYLYFLTQLLKIKDKATTDPLRGLFTLRYFYYRLELELKKIYFPKELFLVFFYLESFKESVETMSQDSIRRVWQHIQPALSSRNTYWSLYSQEELIGCAVCNKKEIGLYVRSLRTTLQMLFKDEDIKTQIKAGYLKLKKEYPIKELLFLLSSEVRRRNKEVLFLQDSELAQLLHPSHLMLKEKGSLLESLDEDIEEMNRQLLFLLENLNREQERSRQAFFDIISSLVKAVETRDPYTEGHSERVSHYSVLMAERLGWNAAEIEKLKKASLLHDLGKIGIPDNILHKKDKLSDDEYNFIKKHTVISVKILEPLKDLKEIVPWIMYHHERWDGKGYPHGLGGNAIPVAAQIIAVADSYDAITTGRDYKASIPVGDALREIAKCGGAQFNPQIVEIFTEVMLEKLHKNPEII